ncbi:M56 family metallopeptidase [Mycobacteroides abscessus]|uniref:Zn-dependent protease with chaperone function n=2 Tax=Mycobacteroides abscessus TaxID=36809 RepID=A0A0U0ZHD0_9MYCO|nr:M56 family metallopeptidase [Mycobacteroides abscessus]MBL3734171.1 M56 family metallopeptidase [Mycobacteroides abscessus subsp. massiliense]MBL3760997.1 M56 family metallopeptidase [Mycobacteroides abscessus subsp. massiliense]MDB2214346.1 M56 family metallopeptidase [Mycobacteroides abscessus subsp. massiliense]MDM2103905.1 M56 family metallopeptidase [Mycobacteroides abscessus]MDM2132584.1 M56 family metallopeptidase [Mycobacteroides abscessus]
MSIAVCLLLYSAAVVVFGPPLLSRLTSPGHAPRLGVTVWVSAIASVLASWAAAAVLIVIDVVRHWNSPIQVLAACSVRLHEVVAGQAGIPAQLGILVIATAAAGALGTLSMRLVKAFVHLRDTAHGHAQAVRIVGRHSAERDVVVMDAAEPAAYCVAGRPATIVLTTAALNALDAQQLAAVVAHERAHLAGRHPQIVTALRALATTLPRVRLITVGAVEVPKLLEMWADDAAAHRHGRTALLSGLLDLAATTPAPALGAANVAVLSRAQRLLSPPAFPTQTRTFAILTTALLVIATGPLITVALAATGTLNCMP